jgi:hypothetical protein
MKRKVLDICIMMSLRNKRAKVIELLTRWRGWWEKQKNEVGEKTMNINSFEWRIAESDERPWVEYGWLEWQSNMRNIHIRCISYYFLTSSFHHFIISSFYYFIISILHFQNSIDLIKSSLRLSILRYEWIWIVWRYHKEEIFHWQGWYCLWSKESKDERVSGIMVSIVDCGSADPCSIHGLPIFQFIWLSNLISSQIINIDNFQYYECYEIKHKWIEILRIQTLENSNHWFQTKFTIYYCVMSTNWTHLLVVQSRIEENWFQMMKSLRFD